MRKMFKQILTLLLVYLAITSVPNGVITYNVCKKAIVQVYCDMLYNEYINEK